MPSPRFSINFAIVLSSLVGSNNSILVWPTLKKAVFNNDVSGGSVISLEGTSNVIIDNVTIDYKTSSDSNSYAVDLINSNNVQLLNNNIRYFTNVTNTNVYNYVIKVVGVVII